MRAQHGFTLIELMIVVAIIAILAALALPAYQDYLVRSQVAEGLSLAGGVKIAVEEYHWAHGSAPTNNADAGVSAPGDISGSVVSSVTVGPGGSITVAYAGPAANIAIAASELQLMPDWASGGSSVWSCAGAGTTIEDKYLPTSCR